MVFSVSGFFPWPVLILISSMTSSIDLPSRYSCTFWCIHFLLPLVISIYLLICQCMKYAYIEKRRVE
jgi:hypothetical protein